jgi:ubiquinone biosynthesis protein
LEKEASQWAQLLPQLPRLMHTRLGQPDMGPALANELGKLRKAQEHTNRLLMVVVAVLAVGIGVAMWALTR